MSLSFFFYFYFWLVLVFGLKRINNDVVLETPSPGNDVANPPKKTLLSAGRYLTTCFGFHTMVARSNQSAQEAFVVK